MPTPFPASAWNVSIFGSGLTTTGNTITKLGHMPPKSGMPVFYTNYPTTPQRYIQSIDVNTGLVTVAVSGATGDQLLQRTYPWNVAVWAKDATVYAWPTGVGCVVYGHTTPGATGNPPRSTDLTAGGGFIYG